MATYDREWKRETWRRGSGRIVAECRRVIRGGSGSGGPIFELIRRGRKAATEPRFGRNSRNMVARALCPPYVQREPLGDVHCRIIFPLWAHNPSRREVAVRTA